MPLCGCFGNLFSSNSSQGNATTNHQMPASNSTANGAFNSYPEQKQTNTNFSPAPPPPRASAGSSNKGQQEYVALYDYDARVPDDLQFQTGHRFIILDKSQSDWWYAKSLVTNREGYVPSNYVAEANSPAQEGWFFGKIARVEAERRLLLSRNQVGTYLIRESEKEPGSYALSLLDENAGKGRHVRHYRIKKTPSNYYCIFARKEFENLQELVRFYSEQADGLSSTLLKPCDVVDKPATLSFAKDVWEISRDTLTFEKRLGAGAFGEVWKGLWNGNTEVAIKTLKPGTMSPEAFLQEATIMKKLRHENLVSLYAVVSDEPICIVTELMAHGSLLDYLRSEGQSTLFRDHLYMAIQIAAGMAYIEQENFIHRDVRAANVLVGHGQLCKVADFGLSRLIEDDLYQAREGAKFPVKWTAPESFTYNRFTIKSDVWSFGVLLAEIVTRGKAPYPGMTNPEVVQALQTGYRMPKPRDCPDTLYTIMLRCWQDKDTDRPSFQELQHTLGDLTGGKQSYEQVPSM